MTNNPLLDVDFYKISHFNELAEGHTLTYSNLTPRSDKFFLNRSSDYNQRIRNYGTQVLLIKLYARWQVHFFSKPLSDTLPQYIQIMQQSLGIAEPETKHIELLHKIGYLPIEVKALDEGSSSPIQIPVLTIKNTHDSFSWFVNYLETYISTNLWKPITMATTSNEFKKVLEKYNRLTADSTDFIPFQVHDFAARGLGNSEEWHTNCIAHLSTGFIGTDTVQAITGAVHYYDGEYSDGMSVPATEHSTMTTGINLIQKQNPGISQLKAEELYLKKLITETYPSGIVSVVSDSYDFWGVIGTNLKNLKNDILNRDGKLVIRPDSGNPIDIICGTTGSWNHKNPPKKTIEQKGLLDALWEIFGGTINDKGYKVLDQHIGIIYGDGITVEKYEGILERMKIKGYSSDNLVIGKGAVGDQLITRDTFGFAIKATACKVHGELIPLFKDPKTDSGKKSAKGLLAVTENFELLQDLTEEEYMVTESLLKLRFRNGKFFNKTTLKEIRERN